MSNFETGKQPCDNYDPSIDGNEYGQWENVHECWCNKNGTRCGGSVSWCMTCNKDHHAGGYESCKGCSSEHFALRELAPTAPSPNTEQKEKK